MSNASTKAYEVIADRIIGSLDNGDVPWRKPWSLPKGMKPQSITGHTYTGINSLLLGLSGYADPRWLTYKKAVELGGNVRRGEKSTPIVFWKQFKVENENANGEVVEKNIPLLRYYSVFNAEQCDGLELVEIGTPPTIEPIQAAESIITNMPHKPSIAHNGGDRAYYVPARDQVHLPPKSAFKDSGEYYSTVFHELGHSTGHSSRLNRHELETGIAPFGSETYSREELVAEFASAFLCHEAGIDNTIENSVAYIQGWSKAIRKDKRLVVQAASQAQKAADCVLG